MRVTGGRVGAAVVRLCGKGVGGTFSNHTVLQLSFVLPQLSSLALGTARTRMTSQRGAISVGELRLLPPGS